MPGTQQYMYLERSPPTVAIMITFEALSDPRAPLDLSAFQEADQFSPDLSQSDRSLLTPSMVRYLLGRYDSCIRPEFDVVDIERLAHDGLGIRKLPQRERFETLMVCAIAAARESYRNPSWKSSAQICREWAGEDVAAVLSVADANSLTAILLLLIYEMAEPSRGSIWELMDLARRTALQLGWHRPDHSRAQLSPSETRSIAGTDARATQDRLLSVLKTADRTLSFIFNRPSMSGNWLSFPTIDDDFVFQLYHDVQQSIYGPSQLYDTNECPFVGHMADLIVSLENYSLNQTPVISEMWLLMLPMCVRHKQCVFCFQEADDPTTRGMRSLRQRLLEAALHLIQHTYKATTSPDGFIPPLTASSRAMVSGCTILVSRAKHWSPANLHLKALLQCTEILTHFMPHWKGGPGYLQVWNTITNLVDKHEDEP